MPNWAENHLFVNAPIGGEADLNAFLQAVCAGPEEHGLQFGNLIAVPENTDPIEMWGTRTELGPGECVPDVYLGWTGESDKRLRAAFFFNTAWAGPDRWVSVAASLYPTLGFMYHSAEGGSAWGLEREYRDGKLVHEWRGSYLEAKIRWDGEVDVLCDFCGDEFMATAINDIEYCPVCKDILCKHCANPKDDHAEGRCLFDPNSTFEAIQAKEKSDDAETTTRG